MEFYITHINSQTPEIQSETPFHKVQELFFYSLCFYQSSSADRLHRIVLILD